MPTTSTPPPYVGYGVFKGVINTLAQSTVPTGPLDRRVLDGVSGADHGALMSGMRFLGLVDDARKATHSYRELVEASRQGEAIYRPTLLNILKTKYAPIIGTLDITHGTISELEKAFKDAGVAQGQMLTKTIRFYVKALTDAGLDVSPHITKAKRPAPATRKNGGEKPRAKPKRQTGQPQGAIVTSFNGGSPNTMKVVTLPLAKGSLTLHGTFNVFDLVGDERDLVFAIIDKMKAFESAHPPEEDES